MSEKHMFFIPLAYKSRFLCKFAKIYDYGTERTDETAACERE